MGNCQSSASRVLRMRNLGGLSEPRTRFTGKMTDLRKGGSDRPVSSSLRNPTSATGPSDSAATTDDEQATDNSGDEEKLSQQGRAIALAALRFQTAAFMEAVQAMVDGAVL